MFYKTIYKSPIGNLTLACDDSGNNLVGLWIEGEKYFGDTVNEPMIPKEDMRIFPLTKQWLTEYFAGENPCIARLPLAPIGGAFRQGVWEILCQIPYGQTMTYGDIAKKMAKSLHRPTMSSQAVGGAVGHNPISIIIPCHRVVGSDGNLTGFAAGIETKVKLLKLEGVDMSGLYIPKI